MLDGDNDYIPEASHILRFQFPCFVVINEFRSVLWQTETKWKLGIAKRDKPFRFSQCLRNKNV